VVVGAEGQFTQGAISRNPRTKYKRSKYIFTVTPIALIIDRDWPQLLQPLAQSLTPVAGLIFETKNRAIFLERFFWRDFSGAALLPVQLCSH